jgi:hypothetical protein
MYRLGHAGFSPPKTTHAEVEVLRYTYFCQDGTQLAGYWSWTWAPSCSEEAKWRSMECHGKMKNKKITKLINTTATQHSGMQKSVFRVE